MKAILDPTQKYDAYIKIAGTTRSHLSTPSKREVLTLLIKKFKLPYKLRKVGTNVYVEPTGMVLGANEKALYDQRKRNIENLRKELATALEAQPTHRPRLTVISPQQVLTYLRGVAQWPEIAELGRGGTTLAKGGLLRLVIPRSAHVGIRFWPVLFHRVNSRRIKWAMTPPIPFVLGKEEIKGNGAGGHPHLYTNTSMCVGNARFAYENVFQCVPLLREWYMGYNPRDIATGDWVANSRNVWRRDIDQFFRDFPEPKVIIAPWVGAEKSEVIPLTRDMVLEFINAPDWVLAGRTDEQNDEGEPSLVQHFSLGHAPSKRKYSLQVIIEYFPKIAEDGWDAVCTKCGEMLEAHHELTCRREIVDTRHAQPSAFDFTNWDGTPPPNHSGSDGPREVTAPDGTVKTKLVGLADIMRRSKELPGRSLWVEETLRKFGPQVESTTPCIDCRLPFGRHLGPVCP